VPAVVLHQNHIIPAPFKTRAEQMAKVEASDDSLYDGTLFSSLFIISITHQKVFDAGLYGEEFEEDFTVPTLGNPSGLTDAIGDDDAGAELVEPPPEDVTLTLEPPPEEEVTRPIPTLDSRPRLNNNVDALPPKPTTGNNGSLSYSAQVAEQFSSAYRQTPSQERGRLDAARLAQFQVNQTGAGSGAGAPSNSEARPIRPSEMKDEGCVLFVFPPCFSAGSTCLYVKGRLCAPPLRVVVSLQNSASSYLAVVSTRTKSLPPCYMRFTTRCYGEAWMASRLTYRVSFSSYFPYLATKMMSQTYPVFSAMSLYFAYAYAYDYPPLCICTPLSLYLPFRYYLATSLQQDVCRRLILGYNRWYFISASSYPSPSFAMSLSILLTH
jgi:hypothetical protein